MKSGTSLDLAGHDHKSVIGWPTHGGPNQQWEFVPSGQGYIIRSAAATSEYGLYLTVKQSISDGAELDVCEFPMSWRAQHDEHNDALRILWSNTEYALCLADNGNMAPGTKAELRSLTPGDPSQMWRFAKCASTTEDQERAARAVAQPFATETVIVAEGQDCTTITRTMTTTTVETVTTVTRIAHARHG
ncbi:hypothetical protein OBBRIDRAFT_730921 [Obba rivulosa]|uniref:Ricin B lectin domain-containing protein n=1 Tax=Obba rivulosa TaxID=1052685 RepID=A0A8E2B1A1_9APHY|nr:hypothetical protein OBBRIDRAFT_730921 [Obba rivulosa]